MVDAPVRPRISSGGTAIADALPSSPARRNVRRSTIAIGQQSVTGIASVQADNAIAKWIAARLPIRTMGTVRLVRLILRTSTCLLLAFGLAACGADRLPTSPTPSVAGTWQGAIDSPTDGRGTITLQLTQTGAGVSGSMQIAQGDIVGGAAGTVTGTLVPASGSTTLEFTVTYTYGFCKGVFSGTLDVPSHDMKRRYSGSDCAHECAGTLQASRSD